MSGIKPCTVWQRVGLWPEGCNFKVQSRVVGRGWAVPDSVIQADEEQEQDLNAGQPSRIQVRKRPFQGAARLEEGRAASRIWEHAVGMQRKPGTFRCGATGGKGSSGIHGITTGCSALGLKVAQATPEPFLWGGVCFHGPQVRWSLDGQK